MFLKRKSEQWLPGGLGKGQRIDGRTEVVFWGGGNLLYFHFDMGYIDIAIVNVVP